MIRLSFPLLDLESNCIESGKSERESFDEVVVRKQVMIGRSVAALLTISTYYFHLLILDRYRFYAQAML